jgi:hypothetical protein
MTGCAPDEKEQREEIALRRCSVAEPIVSSDAVPDAKAIAAAPALRDAPGRSAASVLGVEFSRELRNDVLAGDITLFVRLWQRPRVKEGGRYRVGPGEIEIDAIELVPFAAITDKDVRRAGEPDRETLRQRAAHAGPIDENTLVYRIEFRAVSAIG